MSSNIVNSDGSVTRVAGGTLWADSPIGTILAYGGATAPAGWFICQGQAISRTTYSELFAVIGTSFGTGDGSTTFNLPDLREATTKGVGLTGKSNNHYDGDDGDGVALGEFVEDRVQDHTHVGSIPSNEWGITTGSSDYKGYSNYSSIGNVKSRYRSGATTEVKAVGVNYIIKAKMVAMPSDFMSKVDEAVEEANEYSTTETVVGKWIDGKPIYRKVYAWSGVVSSSGWTDTQLTPPSDIAQVVDIYCPNVSGMFYPVNTDILTDNHIRFWSETSNIYAVSYIVLEYTKTTD